MITHSACGNGILTITAELLSIDGQGGILGYAGPSSVWAMCPTISITGEMGFDEDDVVYMETEGIFEGVILHEMGHCIGIG